MHSFIQLTTYYVPTEHRFRETFCGPSPAFLSLCVLSLWQEVGNAPVVKWRREEAHVSLGSHQHNNE